MEKADIKKEEKMTDIEKEIRRLEKKMQKAKSEEEQLMIWKQISYLEHILYKRV